MHGLQKGMRVNILEVDKVIDVVVVLRVGTGGDPLTDEIEVQSLELNPGAITEFAFIHLNHSNEGWRMLFEDPMAGGRCFSQRAPTYTFEPVS